MQLKMDKEKKINIKAISAAFDKEFKFINNLFSLISLPVRELDETDSEADEHVYVKDQNSIPEAKETKRAHSVQELHNLFEQIKKEKSTDLKDKPKKKTIKTKLSKKEKRLERKKRRKLTKVLHKKPEGFTPKVEKEPGEEPRVPTQTKPVFNSQGKMVFSKFDFSDTENISARKGRKEPQHILQSIEKQEELFKKLKEDGQEDKLIKLKEKIAWKNALAKVEGQKVKDDPELLKKTIKRKESTKKQSKKKWDSIIEKEEKGKQRKQKKRTDNLQKRISDKKAKKIKKLVKKGRLIL